MILMINAQLANNWTFHLPNIKTTPLPLSYYRSEEYVNNDQKSLARDAWVYRVGDNLGGVLKKCSNTHTCN